VLWSVMNPALSQHNRSLLAEASNEATVIGMFMVFARFIHQVKIDKT
jgi:hypothetical protein